MNDISVDQKLQLIRQIRSRHNQNRIDMMNRERILFGKSEDYTLINGYEDPIPVTEESAQDSLKSMLFKLRFLTALILAVFLILMDRKNSPFLGVSTTEIFTMIESDYYSRVEEYIHDLQTD